MTSQRSYPVKIQVIWPKDMGVCPDDLLVEDAEVCEAPQLWIMVFKTESVIMALTKSLATIYKIIDAAQPPFDRRIWAKRKFVADGEGDVIADHLNNFLCLFDNRTRRSTPLPNISRDEDGLTIESDNRFSKKFPK
jgi:hypothetical protein